MPIPSLVLATAPAPSLGLGARPDLSPVGVRAAALKTVKEDLRGRGPMVLVPVV